MFKNPARDLGIQIQWLWDGCVTAAGISEQLASFAAAGISEVVIEAWDGIVAGSEPGVSTCTPYLSEEFLSLIRHAADSARQLGLHLWIYDGNGAGDDTGAVRMLLADRPQLAGSIVRPTGDAFEIVKVHGGLDRLSLEATEASLAVQHDRIVSALGPELLPVLRGFWKDEPRLRGGVPWSPALPPALRERTGFEWDEAFLGSLFRGGTSRDRAARVAFWSTVAYLFGSNHLGAVQRWHHERGLLSLVQPMSDGVEFDAQSQVMGSMAVGQAWADVPGCDMWPGMGNDQPLSVEEAGGAVHAQAVSWAHLHARHRVQAEPYGLQGWGLELAQQKSLADRLYARGINLISPAVTHYAYNVSQATFCGDFGPMNGPAWRFYDLLQLHLCRLGELLAGAEHVADVAVLHPQTSAWALDPETEDDGLLRAAYLNVIGALQMTLRGFDIVNEEALLDAYTLVKEGRIERHDHRFSVVVVPSCTTLFDETLDVLERFAAGGGHVLFAGQLPTQSASGRDDELACTVATLMQHPTVAHVAADITRPVTALSDLQPLIAALDFAAPADVVIDDAPLVAGNPRNDCYHARRGDDHVYLITNYPDRAQTPGQAPVGTWLRSWVHLRGISGVPELWDTASGKVLPVDSWEQTSAGISLWLEIPPFGSALLVAGPSRRSTAERVQQNAVTWEEVDGNWEVDFRPADLPIEVSAPEACVLQPGDDLGQRYPGFSGTATFSTDVEFQSQRALLDLGEVLNCVEVSLDGEEVGRRAWPPFVFEFEVSPRKRQRLSVSVTNTAGNVMPGVDHNPAKRWGLFGPVRLGQAGDE